MDKSTESIAISTRIRLARNYADLPFPVIAGDEDAQEVVLRVTNALEGQDFRVIPMHTLEPTDRQVLVERHLVSMDLLQTPQRSALAINPDGSAAVMINEEDHLRIQAILPGLQLEPAFMLANQVDDQLETQGFAYDDTLGYLTSCPTNAGTGMRASVMMHLPALTMTGYMNTLAQMLSKVGLMVRGIYGEGSEALGGLYQISNQVTMGLTEEDILHNLAVAARQIIQKEENVRNMQQGNKLEDRSWRALGILTHARRLDTAEFMQLLSDLRLGIDMGYITQVDVQTVNQLTTQGQVANLQRMKSRELKPEERDIERAELCRNTLKGASS